MSIETEIIHTLATVEVAEDYRVMVTTSDLDTALSWTQTEQLIAELQDALDDARRMLAEDFPVMDPATAAEVRAVHAFDLAPLCRDCEEGKHGACIGTAFVESGPEIDEVECRCEKEGHPNIFGKVTDLVTWDGAGSVETLARLSHVHNVYGDCVKNRDGVECPAPQVPYTVVDGGAA